MNFYGVGQLLKRLKGELSQNYHSIAVRGEVCSFNRSASGHCYFTLSDREGSLSCSFFRGDYMRSLYAQRVKNGDAVEIVGKIDIYLKRGDLQMITQSMRALGKGYLQEQYNLLKKKLAAAGLFDISLKQSLPQYPKKIGLITSRSAAAFFDFYNIYKRRSLWMNIILSPSLVQGKDAPLSLERSLKLLVKYSRSQPEGEELEVIVLTRGGGSAEDLSAFNDEGLAWEISRCPIPVVSAIGHQVDFTICDHVSDLRCETPSAAAEQLTSSQLELEKKLKNMADHLRENLKIFKLSLQGKLQKGDPRRSLQIIRENYFKIERRMLQLNFLKREEEFLKVYEKTRDLEEQLAKLLKSLDLIYLKYHTYLEKLFGAFSTLNPKKVLERGYVFVTGKEESIVPTLESFVSIQKSKKFKLHFSDGSTIFISS